VKRCVCGGMVKNCPLCGGAGKPTCTVCLGTHYLSLKKLPDGDFGDVVYEVVPCPACLTKRGNEPVRPTGLREGMEDWTFENMVQEHPALLEAAGQFRHILERRRGWGVLYCASGTGKSYLLASVANAAGGQGLQAHYVNTSFLLSQLQEAMMGKNDWTYTAMVRWLSDDVDVLCLNEFGDFNPTAWRTDTIKIILEHRSDPVWRPTFFASNKPGRELAAMFPWLADRFNSSEVFESVLPGVPSLRGQE